MENVSRAALKLHVSQPALSRQVRDLEDELGFPLFERSAKSVRLTQAGKSFLNEARAVLQRVDDAVKTARAVAGGVELHVGYAPSPTARLLPPTLREFKAARVKLRDLSTEEMLAGLRDGRLHVALMVKPSPAMLRGLRFTELLRDRICLAVAPKHPLARKRTVSPGEIAREPLVVYSRQDYPDYHKGLLSQLKKPKIAEEHDGVTSIIAAVESGVGVALLPESVACLAGPRLKLISISPALAPVVVGAVLPAKASAAAEKFLECARKISETAR